MYDQIHARSEITNGSIGNVVGNINVRFILRHRVQVSQTTQDDGRTVVRFLQTLDMVRENRGKTRTCR